MSRFTSLRTAVTQGRRTGGCPTGPPVGGVTSTSTPALWPCTFCSDRPKTLLRVGGTHTQCRDGALLHSTVLTRCRQLTVQANNKLQIKNILKTMAPHTLYGHFGPRTLRPQDTSAPIFGAEVSRTLRHRYRNVSRHFGKVRQANSRRIGLRRVHADPRV